MLVTDHLPSRTVNLVFNALQAVNVPHLDVLHSILGAPGSFDNPPAGFETELAALKPLDVDAAKTLLRASVSVPILDRWIREASGPIDYPGGYAGEEPKERWLFINGICTDRRIALINAHMLTGMFRRPLTILYNATDGFALDLAESAVGKAWDAVTEAASRNLNALLGALVDPDVERVVLVSHSQGTIVAAVLLKVLEELLADRRGVRARAVPPFVSPERHIARKVAGRTKEKRGRHERLEPDDIGKLELYCFANCATSMEPFVALGKSPRHAPWIESFGNEHDLVARLGLLAPPHGVGSARIAGDRYRRVGAWGHFLNAHYLVPMWRDAQTPSAPGLEPFHDNLNRTPRLLGYLNGKKPRAYP
jgi:hypothetical protein